MELVNYYRNLNILTYGLVLSMNVTRYRIGIILLSIGGLSLLGIVWWLHWGAAVFLIACMMLWLGYVLTTKDGSET